MFWVVFPIVLRVSIGGVVDEIAFGFEGSQPGTNTAATRAVATADRIVLGFVPIEGFSLAAGWFRGMS
jgi:hypothetical protein